MVARRPRSEVRRAGNQRIASVEVQDTSLLGHIHASGVGEFEVTIPFPITFTERPILLPGAVELVTSAPEVEHYPNSEMTIAKWRQRKASGGTKVHYTGADVIIRVSGRSDQTVVLSYIFMGKAFSPLSVEAAWSDDV